MVQVVNIHHEMVKFAESTSVLPASLSLRMGQDSTFQNHRTKNRVIFYSRFLWQKRSIEHSIRPGQGGSGWQVRSALLPPRCL